MLKAIIIDDEERARKMLESLILEHSERFEIVAKCANIPDGVLAIHEHGPDVVFLDVEMPEYNGFELLKFIKDVNFEIVFVTAYSEYAIKAFEVSAIDYLLKPIDEEQLKSALNKITYRKDQSTISSRLRLMEEIKRGDDLRKIALPMQDGLLFVEIKDIILLEAEGAYTHFHLSNGSKILVSKPLRVFEELLKSKDFFFRTHRSFLINMHCIAKYIKGENEIVMDNNYPVSIARDRKVDFEKHLRTMRMSL